ncbi:hypothetical protein Cgig2_003033 [Carnegiea gigantea]|uniref:Uncharacterized protein n=1 Tax=Carnegiea gigantea TaxID=171969 RepID=A0A9Q1K4G1_9CARY|nr:hypothetical protein Cgig2_003033 [Carnegiea gigantea]
MADIPPPSCFDISSPMVERLTPQPDTSQSSSIATVFSTILPTQTGIGSLVPGVSVHPHNPVLTLAPTLPNYPFYFNNNFPSIHNSHTSLPLYDPTGIRVWPSSSMLWRHGYAQSEPGSSSTQEYETLVSTLTHVLMHLTFDDLRPRLLLQEQRLKTFKEAEESSISHPALAITTSGSGSSSLNPST